VLSATLKQGPAALHECDSGRPQGEKMMLMKKI
jgi:hypothetical protein